MSFEKLHFVNSDEEDAYNASLRMRQLYGNVEIKDADAMVVLGGDGTMLETLHSGFENGLPIYGMNRGTIGFLMNQYKEAGLKNRLNNAKVVKLHPLEMLTEDSFLGKLRFEISENKPLELLKPPKLLDIFPMGSISENALARLLLFSSRI